MKNRVRELRGERHQTQEDLAEQVGVSRQTIISIENSHYNPSILLAFKIARVFARHIEEVFLCAESLEGEE